MQEDLEVTGISRSGRVRKKSSKLMDFESPDDIETRYRRQGPVKSYTQFRPGPDEPGYEGLQQYVKEESTASGESDFYDNNGDNNESMDTEEDSSDDYTGNMRSTPANSLYMMEKSAKKKLIIKDGKVVGRAKAQRKDKGKTRITAYMMWAKEARNDLLKKHPEMDFSAISKRLGEMWANVNYNERYLWKRKAKRFSMQKEQNSSPAASRVISNQQPKPRHGQVGRPPSNRAQQKQSPTAATQPLLGSVSMPTPTSAPSSTAVSTLRAGSGSAAEIAAHLRLLGESLTIIGERLKEHEGQIAVSGSVSVLLDTLLCSLTPLLGLCRAIPEIAPPQNLIASTLNNIAYIMPGL